MKDVVMPDIDKPGGNLVGSYSALSLSNPGGGDTLSSANMPNEVFFASLGRGYNPFTGKLGIVCVVPVSQDEELAGSEPYVFMHTVSDEKSMAQASANSVSASGMFKFVSAGVGTSSTNSSMFNSVERYGRVYARIATKITDRHDVKWSPEAEQLLKDRKLTEFLQTCGTRYVRTVYAGHLLDETVYFKLNEDSHSMGSSTSLSIGVAKIFGGSASFCDAQTNLNTYSSVDLQSYGVGVLSLPTLPAQEGGAPAPAPAPPAPGAPSSGPGAKNFGRLLSVRHRPCNSTESATDPYRLLQHWLSDGCSGR